MEDLEVPVSCSLSKELADVGRIPCSKRKDQDGQLDVACTQADASSIVVADLDRDGDPDQLVADGALGDVEWLENRGGQFGWVTTDSAPASLSPGTLDDLLTIEVVHRGRPGDRAIEVSQVSVLVERGNGDPLEPAELDALLVRLSFHADGNGNGTFDPAEDPAVAGVTDFAGVAGGVVELVR